MRRKFIISILFVTIGSISYLSAQKVSNVQVQQVYNKVYISYDLDKQADVYIYYNKEKKTWNRNKLKKVSGDVGDNISAGHKTIIWDALSEDGNIISDLDEINSTDLQFDVFSTHHSGSYLSEHPFFCTLNLAFTPWVTEIRNPLFSYGLKIGQLGRVGWFISATSNFNFKGAYQPITMDSITAPNASQKSIRFSGQLGLVVSPTKSFSILLGLGYGYLTRCCQTTNTDWNCIPEQTYSGIDATLGWAFNVRGFVGSLECGTTNFKTLEVKIGLGFALPIR